MSYLELLRAVDFSRLGQNDSEYFKVLILFVVACGSVRKLATPGMNECVAVCVCLCMCASVRECVYACTCVCMVRLCALSGTDMCVYVCM